MAPEQVVSFLGVCGASFLPETGMLEACLKQFKLPLDAMALSDPQQHSNALECGRRAEEGPSVVHGPGARHQSTVSPGGVKARRDSLTAAAPGAIPKQ